MIQSGTIRTIAASICLAGTLHANAQFSFASAKTGASQKPEQQFKALSSPSPGNNIASIDNFKPSGGNFNNSRLNDSALFEDTKPANAGLVLFRTTTFAYPTHARADVGLAEYPTELLMMYAEALKVYAKKNGYDTAYAFLGNMGMLSNKKRFFVINLSTMEIEQSGLVSHGRGQGASIYDKQYSNASGSRCTALGHYKIVSKYKGQYGEAYKMIGLDSTNNNALKRNIVLHSMDCIPDVDNLFPACVSDGCPAVSSRFLSSLAKIINTRQKPVLLWIFDSNLEEPVVDLDYPDPISVAYCAQYNPSFRIKVSHSNNELHSALSKDVKNYRMILWLQWQEKRLYNYRVKMHTEKVVNSTPYQASGDLDHSLKKMLSDCGVYRAGANEGMK